MAGCFNSSDKSDFSRRPPTLTISSLITGLSLANLSLAVCSSIDAPSWVILTISLAAWSTSLTTKGPHRSSRSVILPHRNNRYCLNLNNHATDLRNRYQHDGRWMRRLNDSGIAFFCRGDHSYVCFDSFHFLIRVIYVR